MLACMLLLASSAGARVSASQQVDINHATLAELLRVPGITEVWAQRIVHYRPYRSKLDLLNEGIVPAHIYAKIRESIVAHRDAPAR